MPPSRATPIKPRLDLVLRIHTLLSSGCTYLPEASNLRAPSMNGSGYPPSVIVPLTVSHAAISLPSLPRSCWSSGPHTLCSLGATYANDLRVLPGKKKKKKKKKKKEKENERRKIRKSYFKRERGREGERERGRHTHTERERVREKDVKPP